MNCTDFYSELDSGKPIKIFYNSSDDHATLVGRCFTLYIKLVNLKYKVERPMNINDVSGLILYLVTVGMKYNSSLKMIYRTSDSNKIDSNPDIKLEIKPDSKLDGNPDSNLDGNLDNTYDSSMYELLTMAFYAISLTPIE